MTENNEPTESENNAEKQYAAAHEMHYVAKDLRQALQLYRDILTAHPDARQAAYSRTQIQNIANAVVPKQALLDAQIAQVLEMFGHADQQPGAVQDPGTASAP